jgi:hypothetical protein
MEEKEVAPKVSAAMETTVTYKDQNIFYLSLIGKVY